MSATKRFIEWCFYRFPEVTLAVEQGDYDKAMELIAEHDEYLKIYLDERKNND